MKRKKKPAKASPARESRSPKQRAFLAAYTETCSISAAAESARVSRRSHYDWLADDTTYKEAFEEAKEQAAQILEDEAVRRAYHGILKPIFNAGKRAVDVVQGPDGSIQLDKDGKPVTIPAAVREYSDTLLIFMLKAMRPEKYRDRIGVEATAQKDGGITVIVRSVLQPAEEIEVSPQTAKAATNSHGHSCPRFQRS